MNYEEFKQQIVDDLKDRLGDDYNLSVNEVKKLNQSYEAVTVTPEGSNIGVNMPLNKLYDAIQDDVPYDAVVDRAVDAIENGLNQAPKFDMNMLGDYDQMKNKLAMEVVSAEANAEKLESVPHKNIEDMAVVYRFVLESSESGGASILVTNQMLNPMMTMNEIHAVVLSGGSAFGLGAADGVMQYLEEHGMGFDVGVTKVPLVVQSDIFDLTVGDPFTRPNAAMGYEAAKLAFEAQNYQDGNFGAGCGATVGKACGMETCMKTGIGSYAIQIGELKIGAIVVLNALGDVFDWKNGKKVAGLLAEDKKGFRDVMEVLASSIEVVENKFVGNTTLCAVLTNAVFTKAQLCKIAGLAHDGYARSIRPVHTSADGDSIYALSVGNVSADMDLVGSLAAEVTSEAILRAVKEAKTAYGFISALEFGSM